MIRRLLLVLFGLMSLMALQACTTNAATGRSQFNVLSRAEEIQIGDSAKGELTTAYGGRVPDAALNEYVARIGRELATHTEADYPSMPWEFTLLNSDVINAFALPGGKVFISRGLAEKMDTEAELAGVLGHEIAHVTAEHADKHMSRQMGLQGLAIIGSVIAGTSNDSLISAAAEAVVDGAGVYNLSFGRDEELEADRLGVRYMTKAGYNPRGQLKVMQILQEAAGSGAPPEFLSTHPAPGRRIKQIEAMLADEYAHTQNNPAFGDYESRFQTEFLEPMSRLPLPTDSAASILSDPSLWCSICGR